MDSKPTLYDGTIYRSRTEARWAAFLNSLRLAHDYEPEYYDLGWTFYTPDFYIRRDEKRGIGPFLVEVKGRTPTHEERIKLIGACKQAGCVGLLVVGWPDPQGEMHIYRPFDVYTERASTQYQLKDILGAVDADFRRSRSAPMADSARPPLPAHLKVLHQHQPQVPQERVPVSASTSLPKIPTPPAPQDWSAQGRAIIALTRQNAELRAQNAEVERLNAELFQANSWLRLGVYGLAGLFILLCLAVAILS